MKKRGLFISSLTAILSLVIFFNFNSKSMAYSGFYYTNGYTNVRKSPNGEIVTTLKPGEMHLFNETDNPNWYYIEDLGYVYKGTIQKEPPVYSGYLKKGVNVRDYDGSLLFTTDRPLYVKGEIYNGLLKFRFGHNIYNHPSAGTLTYVYLGGLQKSSPVITGYVKGTTNVRSTPNGKIVGTVSRGEYIRGILEGNWVKFTRNGKTNYIYHTLLSGKMIPANVYIRGGTNIRNLKTGKVIETLDIPLYVEGHYGKNIVRFSYKGIDAYVSESLTSIFTFRFNGYTKTQANVRSLIDKKILYVLPKGEKVYGTFHKNYILFIDENNISNNHIIHRSTVRPR